MLDSDLMKFVPNAPFLFQDPRLHSVVTSPSTPLDVTASQTSLDFDDPDNLRSPSQGFCSTILDLG